jgi:hypothetical protein
MKRGWYILIGLMALMALTAGAWQNAGAQDVKADQAKPEVAKGYAGKLVGSQKCQICHKTEKQGNQYGIWADSKHAQAYATLATDAAKAIAKEKGIADPQKAAECLKCHTTEAYLDQGVALDEKGAYTVEEGIGCEACHGPGSEYKSMSIMKDKEKAIAAGLLLHDQKFCLTCHNQESPTFKEFKYEERWATIAHPVPEAKSEG